MEDKLIEILESFGYEVMRQGSLADDKPYPENFFTFWNNSSSDESHYDNKTVSTVYDYDVNFYSTSPDFAYSKLRDAVSQLKKEGFIVSGDGYDVASDENTHIGRGINVLYLSIKEERED
jgi:hypothetical protein|nr:MAG TPA: hypothetical protein [Caudoviricetes sp.]